VHRDVKPENVFLVDDAGGFRVKLLDFGVAKTLRLGRGLTYTGMIVGTPAYMPPEQMEGEDVDTRADVYSFAAVAYEALTGRRAISASSAGRAISDIFTAVPPAVSTLLPSVPAELDAAFEAALAKEAAYRPTDIQAWGAGVAQLLERLPPQPGVTGWPPGPELAHLKEAQLERGPTLLPDADSAWSKPNAAG
jgi:serine/threonine protein kinase